MTLAHELLLDQGEAARLREWLRRREGKFTAGRMTVENAGDGRLRVRTLAYASSAITSWKHELTRRVLRRQGPMSQEQLLRVLRVAYIPQLREEDLLGYLRSDEEAGLARVVPGEEPDGGQLWAATGKMSEVTGYDLLTGDYIAQEVLAIIVNGDGHTTSQGIRSLVPHFSAAAIRSALDGLRAQGLIESGRPGVWHATARATEEGA